MSENIYKSIGWVFVQQVINSILPLTVMIVLTRRIGSEGWGIVAYLTAFAYLATMVVEFGFYISGQKEVIRYRSKIYRLSNKLSEIISARLILGILTFITGIAAIFFIPTLNSQFKLSVIALIFGIVNGFSFYWVLRGMGLMRESVYIDAIWKILGLIIILYLVKKLEDLYLYFTVLFLMQIMIVISNFYYIRKYTKKIFINYKKAVRGLINGRHISITHILGSLISIGNPIILGTFSTLQQVGFYSAAEKIIRLSGQVFEPVKMALFLKVNQSKDKVHAEVIIYLWVMIIISIIISLFFYLCADDLITILYGDSFIDAIPLFEIMSAFPVIYVINVIFGFLWIVKNNQEKKLVLIILLSIITNLILSILLVPNYGANGMAVTFIITELVMAILFIYIYMYKNNLN